MNKMKNVYVLLIVLSVSLLLLGGCASPAEPGQDNQQTPGNPEPQNNPQNGGEDTSQPPALPEG